MKIVKTSFAREKELLQQKLLRIPAIENLEIRSDCSDGFVVSVELLQGERFSIRVYAMDRAYPKQVQALQEKATANVTCRGHLIIAPYVSNETSRLCQENEIGYLDFSGNGYFSFGTVYFLEKGNPNQYPEKRDRKSIFKSSSIVSSAILRTLLAEPQKTWRLKYLAESVGCSIGQVSKVKDYLCEQLWADMSKEGVMLTNPKAILDVWSEQYAKYDEPVGEWYPCYTLAPIPQFEIRLKELRERNAIDCYLTGLSGGARYAPVVRYNRIHLLLPLEHLDEFMENMECKKVESGANVMVQAITREDLLIDSRTIQGYQVASPVQVYLDCMNLKGRGEEMADAVYRKEFIG